MEEIPLYFKLGRTKYVVDNSGEDASSVSFRNSRGEVVSSDMPNQAILESGVEITEEEWHRADPVAHIQLIPRAIWT